MPAPNRLDFAIGPDVENDRLSPVVTPLVDGVSLIDLVTRFEQANRFDPAGGYGGLMRGNYNFGDLQAYFAGADEPTYLLGCDCGELGCWPLEATVFVDGDSVVWEDFRQPHRRDRDYRGFGPFTFAQGPYHDAVRRMAGLVDPE